MKKGNNNNSISRTESTKERLRKKVNNSKQESKLFILNGKVNYNINFHLIKEIDEYYRDIDGMYNRLEDFNNIRAGYVRRLIDKYCDQFKNKDKPCSIGIYIENQNEYFIRKIIKWVLINKKPLPPIKSVRAAGFHINLSPTNKIFSAILEEIGAVPIQVTYSLKNI